jgi:hypothetical protein
MFDDTINPDRGAAVPPAASGPTTASCLPPRPSVPFLRVEVHVSCISESEGIEVPLGYVDGGEWVAPPFVDDHAGIDQDGLADLLSQEQMFGPPLAFSRDHAAAMVRDTLERCMALAEASARCRAPSAQAMAQPAPQPMSSLTFARRR